MMAKNTSHTLLSVRKLRAVFIFRNINDDAEFVHARRKFHIEGEGSEPTDVLTYMVSIDVHVGGVVDGIEPQYRPQTRPALCNFEFTSKPHWSGRIYAGEPPTNGYLDRVPRPIRG
jgi:hypothetical protein